MKKNKKIKNKQSLKDVKVAVFELGGKTVKEWAEENFGRIANVEEINDEATTEIIVDFHKE